MRKLAAVVVLTCVLMGSAHSQFAPGSPNSPELARPTPLPQYEQDQKAGDMQAEQERIQREEQAQRIKDKEIENLEAGYQRALKASRRPTAASDPWQKLRGDKK